MLIVYPFDLCQVRILIFIGFLIFCQLFFILMWYGTANTRLTTGTFLYLLTWHITKINNKNLISAGKSAILDKKDALIVLKKYPGLVASAQRLKFQNSWKQCQPTLNTNNLTPLEEIQTIPSLKGQTRQWQSTYQNHLTSRWPQSELHQEGQDKSLHSTLSFKSETTGIDRRLLPMVLQFETSKLVNLGVQIYSKNLFN